jgi:hypothetical protein
MVALTIVTHVQKTNAKLESHVNGGVQGERLRYWYMFDTPMQPGFSDEEVKQYEIILNKAYNNGSQLREKLDRAKLPKVWNPRVYVVLFRRCSVDSNLHSMCDVVLMW